MNLLSTTDQLEMLLNQEYNIRIADIQRVCGSVQYYPGNVGTVLANPVKTTTQILLKYDEAGHALEQVDLTSSDSYYANCYNYIGTVANPILSLVDAATGSEEKKTALQAEALTIRAYFHWLAAVKFTKAYDPAKKYKFSIICSSSKNGAEFAGAPGSELIVDDIEIINAE